jgi:predicted PurR-regulated permease PerM
MGVVGVAIVQAILAGIGFAVIGIPGAALWAAICLVLAVVQISMAIIIIPLAIYIFSNHELLPALLFIAWNIPVLALDNVLKPILMGRGVDAPMLVIFVGAIGGFISFGFLGLFFGAVVLVIAYDLMVAWLEENSGETA